MTFYDYTIRMKSVSFVTATLTGNDGQLGQLCREGSLSYMFIYNAGNSEIYPGYAVVPVNGGTGAVSCTVSSASSTDMPIGVVRNATIPTANYGWVVTKGYTKVQMAANASATTGALLEISANGVFDIVSNTTGNYGNACGKVTIGIASGVSGNAFVNLY